MTIPGLDYAFLKYMQVSVEGEGALHGFYVPMLADCARVLDLGCGFGGFTKLLRERGIDAYGVDSDPDCIREARSYNLPVIEADVVDYLRTLEPATLDGIFSAHMVEHMPYEVVLETIQLAHRALKPGGKLLLVTPNPRALISHLELYHMHFGHIALYHPKLLAFFMDHGGFAQIEAGENPHTMPASISAESPLRLLPTGDEHRRISNAVAPLPPATGLVARLRQRLADWLVQPQLTQIQTELQQIQQSAAQTQQTLQILLDATNRPFEGYVIGSKP